MAKGSEAVGAAEAGSCRRAARGVMSASGAVQPGPPGAAVGPSPAATGSPATGPLFRPLSAEDEEQQPTEIESLCMNCYRNGTTRLLLTKIPFFREIIVSSFSCEHCGWNNTEIQSAGRIQDQGVRYTLSVRGQEVSVSQRRYPTVSENTGGQSQQLRSGPSSSGLWSSF